MLTYLAEYKDIFGPLRLFEFLTFRMMMAAATGLGLGFIARKTNSFSSACLLPFRLNRFLQI
ncbi:MAG: hypothetical protein ACQKBV_03435, partial [Puniceicoccales bacterium]